MVEEVVKNIIEDFHATDFKQNSQNTCRGIMDIFVEKQEYPSLMNQKTFYAAEDRLSKICKLMFEDAFHW